MVSAGVQDGPVVGNASFWWECGVLGVLTREGNGEVGRLEERRGRTTGEELDDVEVETAGEFRALDTCGREKHVVGTASSFGESREPWTITTR